jgi:hypothetical protein
MSPHLFWNSSSPFGTYMIFNCHCIVLSQLSLYCYCDAILPKTMNMSPKFCRCSFDLGLIKYAGYYEMPYSLVFIQLPPSPLQQFFPLWNMPDLVLLHVSIAIVLYGYIAKKTMKLSQKLCCCSFDVSLIYIASFWWKVSPHYNIEHLCDSNICPIL